MKWSGPGGVNMIDSLLWWGSVVYVQLYITSRKWTVRLGSLLGLYESFHSWAQLTNNVASANR